MPEVYKRRDSKDRSLELFSYERSFAELHIYVLFLLLTDS